MNAESVESMLSPTSIIVAAKDQISCDLGGEEVILDLRSGVYFGLDAVGARIWQLLKEPTTLANIRDVVMSEYDVERELCEAELQEFFETLVQNGLVEIGN
jgi:hypothetical protein